MEDEGYEEDPEDEEGDESQSGEEDEDEDPDVSAVSEDEFEGIPAGDEDEDVLATSDEESGLEEDEEGEEEEEIIWSPLALAASRSDLTMFNFLIEKYSSRLPAEEFDAALVKAAQGGRSEAFKRLFRDYRHPHQILQDSLEQAAKQENWNIVHQLL